MTDKPLDVRARTIEGFCKAYGQNRTGTYALIAAGKLNTVKAGRRTLILEYSAEAWLRSLPTNQPTKLRAVEPVLTEHYGKNDPCNVLKIKVFSASTERNGTE